MQLLTLDDTRKTGLVLTLLGFLFMFLGVLLFCDRGLLAIGNVLLLVGICFLIGFSRTLKFFNPCSQPKKGRTYEKIVGIVLFFTGMGMLVFRRGWAVIALVIELIGLFQMFGSILPTVLASLRQFPYIGPFLSLPVIGPALDWLAAVAPSRNKTPPV
jgi:hypothetical protein